MAEEEEEEEDGDRRGTKSGRGVVRERKRGGRSEGKHQQHRQQPGYYQEPMI